jgi:hypothetical protein
LNHPNWCGTRGVLIGRAQLHRCIGRNLFNKYRVWMPKGVDAKDWWLGF